jgi:hypothetical protein
MLLICHRFFLKMCYFKTNCKFNPLVCPWSDFSLASWRPIICGCVTRAVGAALMLGCAYSVALSDDSAPPSGGSEGGIASTVAGQSDAGIATLGGQSDAGLASAIGPNLGGSALPTGGSGSTSNPFGGGGFSAPNAPSQGLAVGGWLLYPSLLVGTVFNDNVYLTQTRPTSAWGVEFRPSLIAALNNGIHKTTVYGNLDAQFYTSASQGNTFNGSAGFVHVYEAQRDLIFRIGADVSRFTQINNSGQILATNLLNVSPQQYNQYTATASVSKTFNRLFLDISGSIVAVDYANTTDTLGRTFNQNYQNGTTYSLSAKAGYWFSPVFYAYVQPSLSSLHYNTSRFDSNGYRVVAGIGSDRISLFKGEIYAGFQGQNYGSSLFGLSFGNVTGGVFGAQISWFPTQALTFGLHVDQTLGNSISPSTLNPVGTPTKITTASLTATYNMSQTWSAHAHIDYAYIDYVVGPRRDNLWAAGLGLNYKFYDNLGIALEYKFTRLNSNVPLGSYSQNMITLGATYKY